MSMLNPFKELSAEHRLEVRRQKSEASQARERFKRLQRAYAELMADERYSVIRDELELSLGEQLHRLCEKARGCSSCASYAVRVDALNDIIARPLAAVWSENQRSRMELPSLDANEL